MTHINGMEINEQIFYILITMTVDSIELSKNTYCLVSHKHNGWPTCLKNTQNLHVRTACHIENCQHDAMVG